MSNISPDALIFPASFAQQRLWLLDRLEPNSPLYNVPTVTIFSGRLDIRALEASLNEIVRRHESLRTVFITVEGAPHQLILDHSELQLETHDLGELPREERQARARELAHDEASQPFDLAHGPLLRARLLRVDEGEHWLLLTLHHIITDGWSNAVLYDELSALYTAFVAGADSPLADLAIQYADYAEWQREWLSGEVLEGQLAYWREQLGDSQMVLKLPTEKARPAVQSHRGAQLQGKLGRELTKELKELGQREGATLFMTLLTAFQALLYRYTGQQDVIVGTPIANRAQSETQELIGFFVNTLALRAKVKGEQSYRELLGQVKGACIGAYEHQDLPFEKLVEELQPERDRSRTPIFQVMFDLDASEFKTHELPGVNYVQWWGFNKTAKIDLLMVAKDMSGELLVLFEYDTDIFDERTINRMLEHFKVLLGGIVARPDKPIAELPVLTVAEQQQLFAGRGELAQLLIQHPVVHDAAVLDLPEHPEGQRLTAFVVPQQGAQLTPAKLLDYLRKRLAGDTRVINIVLTSVIPLTPEGNINYKALRALDATLAPTTIEAQNSLEDGAQQETAEQRNVEISTRRAKLSANKRQLLESRLQQALLHKRETMESFSAAA